MERVCTCDNVKKGKPYDKDQCPKCWNFWHIPYYNQLGGGDGKVIAVSPHMTVEEHNAKRQGMLERRIRSEILKGANKAKGCGCGPKKAKPE